MSASRSSRANVLIGIGIIIFAALGFYLRFLAVTETVVDQPIRADAYQYYVTAYNLTKEGVYSASPARLTNWAAPLPPDSLRWPGLPLLIAAFMSEWPNHAAILRDIQWVNIIAGTASILLIGVAAASMSPASGTLTVVLLTAISPHLISFTVYLLTETPSVFFVALLLALCTLYPLIDARWRFLLIVALGVTVGLLALFRPLFAAFVPVMALAVPKDRLKCLALLIVGAALPIAPWLIRNILFVPVGTTLSPLSQTLLGAAYPDYMFNGDPQTFPYPFLHDPNFARESATVASALAEMWRRFSADPIEMLKWYFWDKPPYLWQFSNIDGVGDVFVYPVITTPFRTNSFFMTTHDIMKILQWPIVLSAAIGSILVWLPKTAELLLERDKVTVRAGSLLLIFLTAVHFPLANPARYAIPAYPALFLMAVVAPAILARLVRQKITPSTGNEAIFKRVRGNLGRAMRV